MGLCGQKKEFSALLSVLSPDPTQFIFLSVKPIRCKRAFDLLLTLLDYVLRVGFFVSR